MSASSTASDATAGASLHAGLGPMLLGPGLRQTVGIYFALQIALLLWTPASLLRTLQVANTVRATLVTIWLTDLLFCGLVVLQLPRLRVPRILWMVGGLTLLGLFAGLYHGYYNQTLVADTLTYSLFFLKCVAFFNLFRVAEMHEIFARFLRRYTTAVLLLTILAIVVLHAAWFAGQRFYFNLTPPLLPAFVYSMVHGRTGLAYLVLALTLITGKRMLVLAAVVALLLGFRRFLANGRTLIVLIALALAAVAAPLLAEIAPLPGVARLEGITQRVQQLLRIPQMTPAAFGDFLHESFPHRYNEVRSILHAMDRTDYLIGKGYGFRYFVMENPELRALGVTHSNAHFTPAGILSKFGLPGLLLWLFFFAGILALAWNQRRQTRHAWFAFLVLAGLYAESLLAYVLFLTPFLPIVAGLVLAQREHLAFLTTRVSGLTAGPPIEPHYGRPAAGPSPRSGNRRADPEA